MIEIKTKQQKALTFKSYFESVAGNAISLFSLAWPARRCSLYREENSAHRIVPLQMPPDTDSGLGPDGRTAGPRRTGLTGNMAAGTTACSVPTRR